MTNKVNFDISLDFVSTGINRIPNNLHTLKSTFNKSAIILFGSDINVIIGLVDLKSSAISRLDGPLIVLKGHNGRVNMVQEVGELSSNGDLNLISCDSSGILNYWKINLKSMEYSLLASIKAHTSSITCVQSIVGDDIYIFSSSNDFYMKSWNIQPNNDEDNKEGKFKMEFKLLDEIELNNQNILHHTSIDVNGSILLAMGGTQGYIDLLTIEDKKFKKLVKFEASEKEWIRSLALTEFENTIYLASAGHDQFIKLWKIKGIEAEKGNQLDELGLKDRLSTKAFRFNLNQNKMLVELDAILAGHSDWVFSVCFRNTENRLNIISSSQDKSIIVWGIDEESKIWMVNAQLGEMGGNSLGFYAAQSWPNQDGLFALGYHGAVHSWKATKNDNQEEEEWVSTPFISGHFKGVKSVSWDPKFDYFVTASADQSTRAFTFCPITKNYHEISRPQIHGYDLVNVAFLTSLNYASLSDEKVIRLLSAPRTFLSTYNRVKNSAIFQQEELEGAEFGASVPALGLSNKAVGHKEEVQNVDPMLQLDRVAYVGVKEGDNIVPYENELMSSTLWPEVDKLYGHPNELIQLASSFNHCYLATTCKASTPNHALIRIFNTNTKHELQPPLQGHKLTVTALAFSPSGKRLISAGRDRMFNIYEMRDDQSITSNVNPFQFLVGVENTHSRIIWDVLFLDEETWVTASRDMSIKLWKLDPASPNSPPQLLSTYTYPSPIITLTSTIHSSGQYLLALGLENGDIYLMSYSLDPVTITPLQKIDSNLTPAKQCNQIAFKQDTLVVVSEDCSVRVLEVKLAL